MSYYLYYANKIKKCLGYETHERIYVSGKKKSLRCFVGNFAKFCHLSTKNATIGCDDRFLSTDMVITNPKLEEIKIVYLHFPLFFVKA
jgi:hypothetical protein